MAIGKDSKRSAITLPIDFTEFLQYKADTEMRSVSNLIHVCLMEKYKEEFLEHKVNNQAQYLNEVNLDGKTSNCKS